MSIDHDWDCGGDIRPAHPNVSMIQTEPPTICFTPVRQHIPGPQHTNPVKPRHRRGINADSLYELPEDNSQLTPSIIEITKSSARTTENLPGSVVRGLEDLVVPYHATHPNGSDAKRRKSASSGISRPRGPSYDSSTKRSTVDKPLEAKPDHDPYILQSVVQGVPERTTKQRAKSAAGIPKSKKSGPFKAPRIVKSSVSKEHRLTNVIGSSNSTSKSHVWTTMEDTLKSTAKSFAIAKTTLDKLAAFRFKGIGKNASLFESIPAETRKTACDAEQAKQHINLPHPLQERFSHRSSQSSDFFEVANPADRAYSQVENLSNCSLASIEQSPFLSNHPVTARKLVRETIWNQYDCSPVIVSNTSTEQLPTSYSASEGSLSCETTRHPQQSVTCPESGSIPATEFAGDVPSQELVLRNDISDCTPHKSLSIEIQLDTGRPSSSELVESHQGSVVTEVSKQIHRVATFEVIKNRERVWEKNQSIDFSSRDELCDHDENGPYSSTMPVDLNSSYDVFYVHSHHKSNVGYVSGRIQTERHETESSPDIDTDELESIPNGGSGDFESENYDEGVSDSDLLEIIQHDVSSKTHLPAVSTPIKNSGKGANPQMNSQSPIPLFYPELLNSDNEDEYAMDAEDEKDLLNLPESPGFAKGSATPLNFQYPLIIQSVLPYNRTLQPSLPTQNRLKAFPGSSMYHTKFSNIDNKGASSSALPTRTLLGASTNDRASLPLFEDPFSFEWQSTSFATTQPIEGESASDIDAKLLRYSIVNWFDENLSYRPLQRFARSNFPTLICERSPIIGLSSQSFIRTCFRIGEMYREGKRCTSSNQDAIIELFARVIHSTREATTPGQHFKFADLWSDKPPFPEGILKNYKTTDLANAESKVFIGIEKPKMVRCLGRLKRDSKYAPGWVVHIINIRETDWEEIRYTRTIVSAGSGKSESIEV